MKKQTYRLARHCRLGGVGTEVELTEAEAQTLMNETPGALEGPIEEKAVRDTRPSKPEKDTP